MFAGHREIVCLIILILKTVIELKTRGEECDAN